MKKLIACTLIGIMMLTSSAYATTMEMENHAGEVLERVIENMLAKDANGKAVETEIIQEYMKMLVYVI